MRVSLPQKAVYWPPAGNDGYGQPKSGDPVEFACRWKDENVETINGQGDVAVSSSQVFLLNEVKIGGHLFQGLLATVEGSDWLSPPETNAGVREIISVQSSTTIKGNQRAWLAMLK